MSMPNISGNEWKYIRDCLDSTWVSSVGSYVTLFEKMVAEFCGVRKAIATSNGTAALHISLMMAGVKRNDLVILPNITFVAPANVIKYVGADPILIDVNEHTWQMDLDLLENFLQKETRISNGELHHVDSGKRIGAILPVHVLGNMCDMDRMLAISEKYSLPIVEDATEALGSYYKGKHSGGFGMFGCLSFNGNKIITTGGGGMILTNDEALGNKAKHLTTQAKSDPKEYYHDEVGYNYRLVNILAAMGVAQMEQLPAFLIRKKQVAATYDTFFASISGATPQQIGEDVKANHWLYTVNIPQQQGLRQHLADNKIEARPFWVPMNQLPVFNKDIYVTGSDVSDKIYRNCLSFPCSTNLTDEEQQFVMTTIQSFYA
jgi:perosamine synthetase